MHEKSSNPWSLLLGFSLGGFFDGILLHQILQWHHLLSLVAGMNDLRLQILWDGYFHALMYMLAVIALTGLWRSQTRRKPWGFLLIGFGLWHAVDGLLSHWLLGIHRIRVDSEIPLLWDLLWFFGFGLLPLTIGVFVQRRLRPTKPSAGASVPLLVLTMATAGLAAWSFKAPPDQPFTTVVFSPALGPEQVLDTLNRFDARLVWHDTAMGVVTDIVPERKWALYGNGALLVSGSGVPPGCLDWMRI